ncbi:MAG TPA: hypothetical protein VF599_05960 [Pyrinomonadaceae bacterium]
MSIQLLQNQEDDDFVDMTFGIDNYRLENGYWLMDASALYNNQTVGLRVAVQEGMNEGFVDEELVQDAVYNEGVFLIPLPQLSDALADVWAKEYGFNGANSFKSKLDPFTAIVLEGDGRNIESEYLRIKIFYDKMSDEEMEERYFELFLHVNLPEGLLALNEKDSDYRQPIYQAICT